METGEIKKPPHINNYFGFFLCSYLTFVNVLILMVLGFWWIMLSMVADGRVGWLKALLVGSGYTVFISLLLWAKLPPKETPQIPPAKDSDARLS